MAISVCFFSQFYAFVELCPIAAGSIVEQVYEAARQSDLDTIALQ
jgi:hypothetical protein